MFGALNKVNLVGNLTIDPVRKATALGDSMVLFTIAVPRTGTSRQKADVILCIAFKKLAEFICRNFEKGQWIAVHGSMGVDEYTNDKGEKKVSTKVYLSSCAFCGGYSRKKREEIEELSDVDRVFNYR